MKLSEYQRSRSFFDLDQRSLRFQSQNLFFSKTVGSFGTKIHMKAWGRIGMKIYTNELGHMTNMATMPIYGKNLKKSSSPEPIDPWPWNLVCSIMYGSTTKVVQIKSLVWPWPILRQGQFGHIGFWMEKSENYLFFGNYCSLRSQSCLKHLAKWVNKVEWVSKVKVSLWPWSKVTQISKLKLVFSRNSWAIWNQNSYESLRENRNENLYKWVGSHDRHGCHAHIW